MAGNDDKDSKTEDATPKRRQEGREKGQVPMSTEFVAAMGLCAGVTMLAFGSGGLMKALGELIAGCIKSMPEVGTQDIDARQLAAVIRESVMKIGLPLAAVTLPVIAVSAVAGYGQAGLQIATKALEPDIGRFNPVKGWGRLMSVKSSVRTGMALIKVIMIASVMSMVAWSQIASIVRIADNELGPLLVGLGKVALKTTSAALVVIVALSFIDLLYQRWQHGKDQRMTKQEIKEENKMSDGDPQVKARIRKVQLELALKRMMADLPDATVVVTNPTHYAVALKYARDDQGRPLQDAPICVAKGVDFLAQRIKAKAAEANVVLYENVPLARALYAQVEVGGTIPEELFTAVAVVLGDVYRMKGEGALARA